MDILIGTELCSLYWRMQPRRRRTGRNGTTTIARIEIIALGLRTLLVGPLPGDFATHMRRRVADHMKFPDSWKNLLGKTGRNQPIDSGRRNGRPSTCPGAGRPAPAADATAHDDAAADAPP